MTFEKTEKRVANLHDKKQYTIHTKSKATIKLRIRTEKVHSH